MPLPNTAITPNQIQDQNQNQNQSHNISRNRNQSIQNKLRLSNRPKLPET